MSRREHRKMVRQRRVTPFLAVPDHRHWPLALRRVHALWPLPVIAELAIRVSDFRTGRSSCMRYPVQAEKLQAQPHQFS